MDFRLYEGDEQRLACQGNIVQGADGDLTGMVVLAKSAVTSMRKPGSMAWLAAR